MKLITAIALAAFSVKALAIPIAGGTCGVPDRTATLTLASQCASGLKNPKASDLATYYSGDSWANVGELTADGTDSLFSATANNGWGVIPNSGTWAIDASFWTMYDEAVISMHIGNGAGDPDHWAWLVLDLETAGTWSLDYVSGGTGKGGGLSNLKLWGRGSGTPVPAPGILGLMFIGLTGMTLARRRCIA